MEKWSSLSLSRLGIDLDALAALSEHDRELAEQELLEIERAFRANPLLGYEPHAKQIEFHCRFVTPDLSMTLDGVLMERLRQHAPQEAFRGGTWDRAFNKQLRLLS